MSVFVGLEKIDGYEVFPDGGVFCGRMNGRLGCLFYTSTFGWVFDPDRHFFLEVGALRAVAIWLDILRGEV